MKYRELRMMMDGILINEAKLKIAAKWSDEKKKIKMLRKGMIKHYFNLNTEQKQICNKYFQERLSGNKCKAPDFLNRCYFISSIEKIEKLFGSIDNFWRAIETNDCAISS